MRRAFGIVSILTAAFILTACGEEGSSGTEAPATGATGAGCAPVAGQQLVALTDDKKLQTADNVVAAVTRKASNPQLLSALDLVAASLDTPKLTALRKAVEEDRKTPKVAAEEFANSVQLGSNVPKGPGGKITIGAANFSENQILGELYRIVLTKAGYSATVQQIGNRDLYEPALEKGEIQVVPEYAGTLTEFLNKKVNGESAAPLASGDIEKTMTELRKLGERAGLVFGTPSAAADQNTFAVTKALADQHGLTTLSDFAAKCSGKATVLGGPPECPQRPFCQPGLEQTYGISFGSFSQLDPGGPLTKTALRSGQITIGMVLSTDPALATG